MSVSDLCRRGQWLVWKAAAIAAALAIVAGCTKDSPAAPTPTPPVVPEEIPPAPVARLAVSVDSRGSLVAISSLSEVKLDATGSSGTGLRYALDFGTARASTVRPDSTSIPPAAAPTDCGRS